MKQTLLLMVLALGMCSTIGFAQEKKYHVEDDGFEWYLISQDGTEGAQDKYGRTILPVEYKSIFYSNGFFEVRSRNSYIESTSLLDQQGHLIVPEGYYPIHVLGEDNTRWIKVWDKDNHEGAYNIYGKCIIPISRKYVGVTRLGDKHGEKNVYYQCRHNGEYYKYGKFSICDASGKVVFTTSKEYRSIGLVRDKASGKYALVVLTDHWFFINMDERILWDPQCYTYSVEGSVFKIQKSKEGPWRNLTQQEKNKILFSADLLKGNTEYFAHASEYPMHKIGETPSSNSTASSNAGSNSNNNPGSGTTTVVVEHQHTPQPVQQWQACWACGGMGTMGCDNCGGSGYKYIGDRLHRCSRCNTRGEIPCNVCYGQKGQYITVYQ